MVFIHLKILANQYACVLLDCTLLILNLTKKFRYHLAKNHFSQCSLNPVALSILILLGYLWPIWPVCTAE